VYNESKKAFDLLESGKIEGLRIKKYSNLIIAGATNIAKMKIMRRL